MSKIEKQAQALALFSAPAVKASLHRDQLVAVAQAQFQSLVSERRSAPYRAILLGLTLHKLKATCKRGEWEPLYKQMLTGLTFVTAGTAKVLASYYMRLSIAFLGATDAGTPEFLALPGSQADLSLDSQDATAARFMSKMADYVDDRSLEEILNDEGIKNKKPLPRGGSDDDNEDEDETTTIELSVQERFNEIETSLQAARKAAADKAVWMSFSKQQHAELKAAAEETAAYIATLFVKTHGKNAKK